MNAATPITLDPARRAAVVAGRRITLGARAFDLLATLAAQPGRVFADEDLIEAVWPGRVVEGNNLRVQIAALRKQLGANAIVNVAGRGYALAQPPAGALGVPPRGPRPPPVVDELLLGRQHELAALLALQTGHRLVTLIGAGGIGKTRLAQAVAWHWHDRHADGACWIDLAPLTHAQQIAPAIVQATEVQTGSLDSADAPLRLARALAGRDGLLVLDNAEHLAAALAPLLHTLLQGSRTLGVLVTSQQLLHVPGEQAFRLDALPVPPPGATAAQARGCAALQLLLRRAQAADQRFTLHDADLPAAAELCRRLDGIPLAIEMAGARLPMLGLAALNAHLDERLRLLGDAAGANPPRHRTLRAALDWSHALLSADEQAALRRLSVFAAPFRLSAAQQVVACGRLDDIAALQAIVGLADKSLLQIQPAHDGGGPQRYRLLDSTRLYAADALAHHGETAATQVRHAQAMAVLAECAQAAFWHTPDRGWRDAWQAEHDDWLLGFDRACSCGDADSAAVIGEALGDLAQLTGVFGALRQRLPAVLALLPRAAPLARARLWDRSGAGVHAVPGLTRVAAAQRRVQAWRAVGDTAGLCRALATLSAESQRAADAEAADAALAEARTLADPAWPPRQQASCVPAAAYLIAAFRGDTAAIRSSMQVWLAAGPAGGAWRLAAQALGNLAIAALLDGDLPGALRLQHEAVAAFRALGGSIDTGINLAQLCAVLLEAGDATAARNAAEHALLLLEDDDDSIRHIVEPLARLAWLLHRPADAARMLGAADALRQQRGPARDALEARSAAVVRSALAGALSPAEFAARHAEGARLDAAGLRGAALAWLHAAL